MTDQFVKIREQTGCFNLADPSEESTEVYVEIPEYGFETTFSFSPGVIGVSGRPWVEALRMIVRQDHHYVRQTERAEELEEIVNQHEKRIMSEWAKYRLDQIEEQIDALESEHEELSDKL